VSFVRPVVRSIRALSIFGIAAVQLKVRKPATRQLGAAWLHRFAGRLLHAMDITYSVEGVYPERGCIISNHVTYIDIPLYSALHACVFVSKQEIASWPVIGYMTATAGTVFVERGRGGSAARSGAGMKKASDDGLPVVFFPEGTTGDGLTLLSFRSGLLAQARAEGQPVTAAHVRYTLRGKNPPGTTVKEDVSYYDDTPILKHMFRFLKLRGVHADVRFADAPIVFKSGEDDRKAAAEEARAAVQALADQHHN